MNEKEALIVLAALALLSGWISRRYLPRDTRMVLSFVGALLSVGNMLGP